MSTNEKTATDEKPNGILAETERVLRVEQDARLQKVKTEVQATSKESGQEKQPVNPDG